MTVGEMIMSTDNQSISIYDGTEFIPMEDSNKYPLTPEEKLQEMLENMYNLSMKDFKDMMEVHYPEKLV